MFLNKNKKGILGKYYQDSILPHLTIKLNFWNMVMVMTMCIVSLVHDPVAIIITTIKGRFSRNSETFVPEFLENMLELRVA